jgi:predicted RNA binding protein YcfA (HicA-like mRNA interferase family)
MSEYNKILMRILKGTSDSNIPFSKLCQLLKYFGFKERIKGSHHILTKPNVEEILNIQPKANLAKPYQVKQVRRVILKYKLGE